MRTRSLMSVLILAGAVACSDQTPTAGPSSTLASFARTPQPPRDAAALLTNIPVSTENFTGSLSITRIGLDPARRELVFTGTVTRASDGLTDQFVDVPAILGRSEQDIGVTPQQAGSSGPCSVLVLAIQPLDLRVLGLTLELSIIRLDANAVPGPGNSLGNLLCAIAGLLDNAAAAVSAIDAQLDRVNTMLADGS